MAEKEDLILVMLGMLIGVIIGIAIGALILYTLSKEEGGEAVIFERDEEGRIISARTIKEK